MNADETTRLRALLKQTEMPWRAVDVVDGGTVLGRGTAILRPHSRWLVRRVAEVDMGDGEECDTSHAALIVAAVNALPGLLDRVERAERERDDLAATLETRNAEHALAMARVRELEARLEFADRGLKTLTDAGWELATERDRLRAIIAGRTTPPTDAELAAHSQARCPGLWITRDTGGNVITACGPRSLAELRREHEMDGDEGTRWIPLDAAGRPCAWPTAEVSR